MPIAIWSAPPDADSVGRHGRERGKRSSKLEGTARWIICGVVGVIGVLGLFAAAHAADGGFYLFGLLLFAFSVLFVFAQIKAAFDEADAGAEGHRMQGEERAA